MGDNSGSLTFREILDASVMNLGSGTSLTIVDVLIGLISSLLCAGTIFWVYRETYQGVLYQKSFNIALILVCLITTSVIMVISGNLILSLGMVGALSIVRFRSAIKDPLDIVFMFWAITVGIANGIGMIKLSIICTLLISLVCFILYKIPKAVEPHVLIVKFNKANMNKNNELTKYVVKLVKIIK